MGINGSDVTGEITRYAESYLKLTVQSSDGGIADPQLASIIPLISSHIGTRADGVIIDIGCGKGSFLKRLIELPSFTKNPSWIYVGVEEEEGLREIRDVAMAAKVNRRTEFYTLEEFYSEWPIISNNQMIFCRNVMHELNIKDSSVLLTHIANSVKKGDTIIFQDLMKMPEAERHNACWTPERLYSCFERIGFIKVDVIPQSIKSGNAYFNLTCEATGDIPPDESEIFEYVKAERRAQWNVWSGLEIEASEGKQKRAELVEALDLDLQLAALTRQLADAGEFTPVSSDVAKRIRASQFTAKIQAAASRDLVNEGKVQEIVHFRERGAQLTVLEEFLRGDSSFALIHGGAGYGKTTLITRLLSTRSYGKSVIQIDGRVVKTFWSFLETFFSQVGLRLSPEQLSVIDNINIGNALPAFQTFLNAHASKIILVYDNFDLVVDSKGMIADEELGVLIQAVIKKSALKFICLQKSDIVPRQVATAISSPPIIVRVGRYATDDTVRNVLDDYFDRSAAGITNYPDSLLSAIDRHPLIAALAARILQQDGKEALLDTRFINQLKLKLRSELWNRIVDSEARPAVAAAAQLRIAVPASMLERLAPKSSVLHAKETEVVYSKPDQRWKELLAVLGIFRLRDLISEEEAAESFIIGTGIISEGGGEADKVSASVEIDHYAISSLYKAAYKIDDDPKWIRESYFHQLLASGGRPENIPEGMGKYYVDELIASADYYFSRARDFPGALILYNKAGEITPLRESAEMRRASCLVRTGDLKGGDRAYQLLIAHYPDSLGIKTSYIDALIYRGEFETAQSKLISFSLKDQSYWVRWQWGRVYGGLDQYDQAIETLRPLVGLPDGDPHYHVHYARALRNFGDYTGALTAINAAAKKFPKDTAVITAKAVEQMEHGADEARVKLEELFTENQSNTRAAAALIRIALEDMQIGEAMSKLHLARPHSPSNTKLLIELAEAEILLAKGQPEVAQAKLKHSKQEGSTYIVILESLIRRAKASNGQNTAISAEARKLPNLGRLIKNAAVQVKLAELALVSRDRSLLGIAVSNLSATRIPRENIEIIVKRGQDAGLI